MLTYRYAQLGVVAMTLPLASFLRACDPPVLPGPGTTSTTAPRTTPPPRRGGIVGRVGGGVPGAEIGPDEAPIRSSSDKFLRFSDGSCRGWQPDSIPSGWTGDIHQDSVATLLDADTHAVLATVSLGPGKATNLGPEGGTEMWECDFTFSFGDVPLEARYALKVGALGPWPMSLDPVTGEFVAPVDMLRTLPGACPSPPPEPPTPDPTAPPTTFAPPNLSDFSGRIAGDWSFAANDLCAAGVVITGVRDVCVPVGLTPDLLVAISDETDPAAVYLDRNGVHLDTPIANGLPRVHLDVTSGAACPADTLDTPGIPGADMTALRQPPSAALGG